MDEERIHSALNRITKKQKAAIARLTSEWGVLHSVENLIFESIRKQYAALQFGAKRPPELVELESQQKGISERKREISTEIVRLEENLRPRRRPPGRPGSPMVRARNAYIRTLKNLTDNEICLELDDKLEQRNGPSRGLPEDWTEKYGVTSYHDAYKHQKCRKLVQKLISAAKAMP
jgi:hypothetical protein